MRLATHTNEGTVMSLETLVKKPVAHKAKRPYRKRELSAEEEEHTGRWKAAEHQLFLDGLKEHGKSWKKIAKMIPSRSVVQVRTHAQKHFKKQAKEAQLLKENKKKKELVKNKKKEDPVAERCVTPPPMVELDEDEKQKVVADAIEILLRDEEHTRELYLKHRKELSKSHLPGVVPVIAQLFSPPDAEEKGEAMTCSDDDDDEEDEASVEPRRRVSVASTTRSVASSDHPPAPHKRGEDPPAWTPKDLRALAARGRRDPPQDNCAPPEDYDTSEMEEDTNEMQEDASEMPPLTPRAEPSQMPPLTSTTTIEMPPLTPKVKSVMVPLDPPSHNVVSAPPSPEKIFSDEVEEEEEEAYEEEEEEMMYI